MKNAKNDKTPFSQKSLRLNFVQGETPSLEPHQLASSDRGASLGKWLFEGLTRLNLKGEYILAGAEAVEISPCQKRYTFTLRPNFYSDGTPVVAHDYERCWKQAIAPKAKCPRSHLFYYIKNAEAAKKKEVSLDEVGVKALDDKTLVVELVHPTPYFLALISKPLFHPFKIKGDAVIFSGPYKVAEHKKDVYLNLEPNPFFWDRNQIKIKSIHISMIRDSMTALDLYKQGELDWIGDPFIWLPSDAITSELNRGTLSKGPPVACPFWLHINTQHPILSSRLIRKALHLVIDRHKIASHLFSNDSPLFTPFPSSSIKSSSNLDLTKAKDFFEQGLKELGLTKETCPALKLSSCNLIDLKKLAEYLKEIWEASFNIQVDLEVKDWNTFYADITQGNYQIGGFFISSQYDHPMTFLEVLASNHNFSRWKNSQYRETIEKLKRETNTQVRAQLTEQAQAILEEELPVIWIVNKTSYLGYHPRLKDVCFDRERGNPDFRWAYFE